VKLDQEDEFNEKFFMNLKQSQEKNQVKDVKYQEIFLKAFSQ
jgi:hypothetical protein